MKRGRKARKLLRRVGRLMAVAALICIALSAITTVSLRWLDPPTSSFMLQRQLKGWLGGKSSEPVVQEWVPWTDIPASVPLAVVAAEDQRFPVHRGFDLVEIRHAIAERGTTGRMRGASTISQQVAKNLFLWPGRAWVRKGLEAYFTVLIELSWPKRRILEVYLNIAQFGDTTFGVGAASWRFFFKPPAALTPTEAALLAAVLPNPIRMRVDAPSAYVKQRAEQINQQAQRLGTAHLNGL